MNFDLIFLIFILNSKFAIKKLPLHFILETSEVEEWRCSSTPYKASKVKFFVTLGEVCFILTKFSLGSDGQTRVRQSSVVLRARS